MNKKLYIILETGETFEVENNSMLQMNIKYELWKRNALGSLVRELTQK